MPQNVRYAIYKQMEAKTTLFPLVLTALLLYYLCDQSKLNAFHGLLLLPKPYGKLKKVLVLAEVSGH